MAKEFLQDELSKRFINHVDKIIKLNPDKDYTKIAEEIKYDKSSVSNVIKGRRNIPYKKYKEFADLYNINDKEEKKLTTKEEIAALKAAVKVLSLSVTELKMKESGKSLVEITLEFEKMIKLETEQILNEGA